MRFLESARCDVKPIERPKCEVGNVVKYVAQTRVARLEFQIDL